MSGSIGKAFRISSREAKGYGYVDRPQGRGYRRNAGVTAIAAINGPGAYARGKRQSARSAMRGLNSNQRRRRAAELTRAEREAFTKRMQAAKEKKRLAANRARRTRARTPARVAAGRTNIKLAQAARRQWGRKVKPGTTIRVGPKFQQAAYGRKPKVRKLQPGVYSANRGAQKNKRRDPMIGVRGRRRPVGMRRNKQTPAQRRASLRNLRKARASLRPNSSRPTTARRPARRRSTASALPRKSPRRAARSTVARRSSLAPNRRRRQTVAQRRASLRNLRKARASLKPNRRRAGTRRRTTRRKTTRRSSSMRRNGQTAAQRRASLRNLRKARASLKPNRRRASTRRRSTLKANRRRVTRRKTTRRRASLRRNGQTAAQRRASLRNLRKARASLKPNRRRASTRRRTTRRKTTRRRASLRRNGQTAAQRRASLRNLRKARSTRSRGYRSNRRRVTQRRSLRRNAYRRPSRFGSFRRNQSVAENLVSTFKAGLVLTAGFTAHKALTYLVNRTVVSKLFPPAAAVPVEAPVQPTVEPAAEPASGLGGLSEYSNLISGFAVAVGGIIAVQKLVQDSQTRMLLSGGMATSLLHTAMVAVLSNVGQTQAAAALSGSDSTAARLSAMYGVGALPGASIQPMYAPAAGLGQPMYQAAAGLGQPALQAAAGMGEYFESGVEGLGNYTGNPEIVQAAAGFGAVNEIQGAHIDPASDLDRELSIAEAAAGVGMGEYFDSGVQGLGDFYGPQGTVDRSSTWIPGQTDPSIWAGTRPISRSQQSTSQVTAGVLQSAGGSGVLG